MAEIVALGYWMAIERFAMFDQKLMDIIGPIIRANPKLARVITVLLMAIGAVGLSGAIFLNDHFHFSGPLVGGAGAFFLAALLIAALFFVAITIVICVEK